MSSLQKIGFVGLGIMGGPMAANLVRAGFDVTGYNRSRPPVDRLAIEGGTAAGSIAEAVREADFVITMLPDSPDVEAAWLGKDGVINNALPRSVLVDMSTIRPDVARTLAQRATAAGLGALDAPVSGGEAGAVEGTLSVMVGGNAQDFERCRPVLQALGSTVVHVGPSGAGQIVKAANQLIVAGNLELVAEALVFLEAYKVDTAAAVQVLRGGLAGSTVLERKCLAMLERNFRPGFRLELHHKDLGIVLAAARDVGVAVPLGSAVSQAVTALVAQGYGKLDHSTLLKLVEQLSGRAENADPGALHADGAAQTATPN